MREWAGYFSRWWRGKDRSETERDLIEGMG
jgi:hypothetical protein